MNKIIITKKEIPKQEPEVNLNRLNFMVENMSEDELMHYGVIGMKWGIRKGDIRSAHQKKLDTTGPRIKSAHQKNIDSGKTFRSAHQKKLDARNAVRSVQKNYKLINNKAQPEIQKAIDKKNKEWPKERFKKATKIELDQYFEDVSKSVVKAYTKQTEALLGAKLEAANMDWKWTYDIRNNGYPEFIAAQRKG